MDFTDYIKPELFILIPVLYLIGMAIKSSQLENRYIPFIIGTFSIVLCALWVFAVSVPDGIAEIAVCFFTAITQGILLAGASVYANQLFKQFQKGKGDE